MPESELAGKITKLVRTTDKLVRNIKKGVSEVVEAVNELKNEKPPGEVDTDGKKGS